MLDYLKLYIHDKPAINRVLNNEIIKQNFTSDEDGVLIGIKAKYQGWKIQTLSPTRLEIAGSIHKYWNNGTNENDFYFCDVITALKKFCKEFDLSPSLVYVVNLEFGVNLQLQINASEIIDQIICFNNLQPIRAYQNLTDCYFIEFEQYDYYYKTYDKGKQYRKKLPDTPNTCRMEVKGRNSRFLQLAANVNTLDDLLKEDNLQVLGMKFAKLSKGIVFDDDSINENELCSKDRKLYRELRNPRNWRNYRGKRTSTFRNKVNRFKNLVETKGRRKIYSVITRAINDKIIQLSGNTELANLLSNTYTWNTAKKRCCCSCGKDISHQTKSSRFCSAKFVGEKEAHKCRNRNSNRRNNLKTKIKKINAKGVLFDILPFIVNNNKKQQPHAF